MSKQGPSPEATRFQAIAADGTIVPAIHTQPLYGRKWDGFTFERHVVEPGALPETVMAEHCFAVPLSARRVPIDWRVNGELRHGAMTKDHIFFRAAGDAFAGQWHQPLDALYVSVSDSALRNRGGGEPPTLYTHLNGVSDAPLLHVLQALNALVREHHPGGLLLHETLLTAIGLRLADLFARPGERWRSAHARLHVTPALLRRVEDFINAHLTREFSIGDVAASVHLSQFHLCRVFKQAHGISLWQYVLRRRVEYAARLMRRHPDDSLTVTAAASGFESYEQFVAAFRKHHGLLPRQFRAKAAQKK
jgi:AraC family transcriptional regulator